MKPIFHTFEAHNRKVTLCLATQKDSIFFGDDDILALEEVILASVGIAILNPNDVDRTLMLNGKERNFGEVLAEGRAVNRKGKYYDVGCFLSEIFENKHVAMSMLRTIEFDFKKNPQRYITAYNEN